MAEREEGEVTLHATPDFFRDASVRIAAVARTVFGCVALFAANATALTAEVATDSFTIRSGVLGEPRLINVHRPAVASDSAIAPRVGGSAAFRAFFRDELIPAIASRYAVTRERAIIGESLAGFFIVETFLLEPALFDHYIALDPSLWWNDGHC